MPATIQSNLKLLYAAGPGNVIGTYHHWVAGRDDPSEVSATYSGAFFDLCRELGARAYVIASHPDRQVVTQQPFKLAHRPMVLTKATGIFYHLGQVWYALRLILSAVRFRADVAVVSGLQHWFMLTPMKWFGIRVVPSLHCAFWPTGHPPRRWAKRVLWKLNSRFWRRVPAGTICISPECERQVRQLAPNHVGPIVSARPLYRRSTFDAVNDPPPRAADQPMCVMFAGRIEANKGVFLLLDAATQLQQQRPGHFQWHICGDGGALEQLRTLVRCRHLEGLFHIHGKLDQAQMIATYCQAHVVVVPTTSGFAEGLNKVAVEAVLAGRPVVTSSLSNALDVLGEAIEPIQPDDPTAIADALGKLADNPALYEQRRQACAAVRDPFYDPQQSWAAALRRVLCDHIS